MLKSAVLVLMCSLSLLAKTPALEEMVAQMIVIGFDGSKEGEKWVEQIAKDIKREKIGGIYLTDKNIQNATQTRKLTDYLKAQAPQNLPLMVIVENEGEDTTLFGPKKGFAQSFSANELGSSKDISETADIYEKMSQDMQKCGINVNFAPVLDLQQKETTTPRVLERSYASYEEMVTTYATLYIDAMKRHGITPVVKYFPTAGSNLWDHFSSEANATPLWRFEQLKPYYDLIARSKVDAVLLSHAKIDAIDPNTPALFSERIVQALLRSKMHFDGLIFADNLRTNSLSNSFDFKQRVIKSVQAGADVLVFSNYFADSASMPYTVQKILVDAVRSGAISQNAIERSYERILNFKQNLSKRGNDVH